MAYPVTDFDFILPEELIAKHPVFPRDHSRLLHFNAHDGIRDTFFHNLPHILKKGDLLILNDTKVIPSYFTCFVICDTGSAKRLVEVQINLTKKLDDNTWQIVAKHGKKIRVGSTIYFKIDKICGHNMDDSILQEKNVPYLHDISKIDDQTVDNELTAVVIDREGRFINIKFSIGGDRLVQKFHQLGIIPLPPYLKRKAVAEDYDTYQTIYAKHAGAVAAPTAGLHFTDKVFLDLHNAGVELASLTLHVGGGTFLPIKTSDIGEHKMHGESFSIKHSTIDAIANAKAAGRRIICVGTTTLRVVEYIHHTIMQHTVHHKSGNDNILTHACSMGTYKTPKFRSIGMIGHANGHHQYTSQCTPIHNDSESTSNTLNPELSYYTGETDLYITPGYQPKIADGLITNFHLPKSTLFVLVCAILGIESAKKIYKYAIDQQYRFFSYGDVCFFEF